MQWRQYQGILSKVVTVTAVLTSVYAIVYLLGTFLMLGTPLTLSQHSLIFLAFMLTLAFLLLPARKGASQKKLPWYDLLLIVLGDLACIYGAVNHIPLQFRMAALNTTDIVAAFIIIIVVVEAVRRAVGWALAIVMLAFLVYINMAPLLPGVLRGPMPYLAGWIGIVALSPQGIPGIALTVAAGIMFIFVFFGEFLQAIGADDFFKSVAFGMTGRYRGGPAKAAVVASCLFGTISGSTTANLATVGVFTIPVMKKVGYQSHYAGAVEAAASNGGQIMPPVMGAVAFIIAEILAIPYLQIVAVSLLPALLYFAALFIMIDLEAVKQGIKGLPASEVPSVRAAVKRWWFCVVPVIALVFLLSQGYTAETAGLWSLALFVPLLFLGRKAGENRMKSAGLRFMKALRSAPISLLTAAVACAGVGIMVAAVSVTGLGLRLSSALVTLSGGNLLLLLILAAMCSFVLGMGMGSVPVYIIVVLMVAPALIDLGVMPLAAHLFVFWWALTAFLTPPVAIAAYVAAAIAQTDQIFRVGWQATRLAFVAFFLPFAFVFRPALLLQGPVSEIVISTLLVVIGIVLLSGALAGYLLRPLSWPQRLLLFAGGGASFSAFPIPAAIGIAAVLPLILYQVQQKRKTELAARVAPGQAPG